MGHENEIKTVWAIIPMKYVTGFGRVMVRAYAADSDARPEEFTVNAVADDRLTFMEADDAVGALDLLKRLPDVGPMPPDDAAALESPAADLALVRGKRAGYAIAWILVLEGGGLRSGVDSNLSDADKGLAVLLMDRMKRVLEQAMDAFMPPMADTK